MAKRFRVGVADTILATPTLTEVEGSRRTNLQRALLAPGAPRSFAAWNALLDEELDAVILCPEINQHAEVVSLRVRRSAAAWARPHLSANPSAKGRVRCCPVLSRQTIPRRSNSKDTMCYLECAPIRAALPRTARSPPR